MNKDTRVAEFAWKSEFGRERPVLLYNYGLPAYISSHFGSVDKVPHNHGLAE